MWSLPGYERRLCPPEYNARLREIGGVNRFGENNWRLIWGETATEIVGGRWRIPTGKTEMTIGRNGQLVNVPVCSEVDEYREVLKYGDATWVLERWFPPEEYGSEERYYRENADPSGSGLCLLGPYPDQGYYESCYKLTDGESNLMQLNDYVLDSLVALILKTYETTEWERRAAREAERLAADKAEHQRKIDMYVDKQLESDPISYEGQTSKTARKDRVRISDKPLKDMPKGFGQIN
jgi:hypothetical protein